MNALTWELRFFVLVVCWTQMPYLGQGQTVAGVLIVALLIIMDHAVKKLPLRKPEPIDEVNDPYFR